MNAVECHITSIILPRVIPSRLFVSWRCGRVIGKSSPFPATDQMIQLKEKFIVPKQIGEELSIYVGVNATDKQGNSIKFSDSQIQIPETIYSRKSVFQQGICQSSIGEFIIEIEFIAKNHQFEVPNINPDEVVAEYNKIVDTFESTIDDDNQPERYIKATELLNSLAELPAGNVTDEHIQKINEALAKLESCNQKLSGRYDLIVKTILGMMEKDYLFVLPTGDVKSYGVFHNSQQVRYPYIGVILANTLKKLVSPKLGFTTDELDHFMIEICSLFAGLIANNESHDRGLMYLISNMSFVIQFVRANLKLSLPNFETLALISYKQIIAKVLDIDINQISKFTSNPKKFVNWYKDHVTMGLDLGVPKNILTNHIHGYLIKYMDFNILKYWLAQPNLGTADYQELITAIPGNWPYLSSLMFMVKNAEKLVKKKIPKDQIYAPCRGSIFLSVIKKLEALKIVSVSQRQYAAITEPDKMKCILQGHNDFAETITTIATDDNIPADLPEPKTI